MAKFRSLSSLLFNPARLFSTSNASSSSLPFTVHYLVNTCGVPLESAMSVAKKLQIRETATKKPDAVISFLKSYGFDDAQLASIITRWPNILASRPQTTLKPKIEFFIENGFTGSLLREILVKNPDVLRRSVESHLKPSLDFLRRYIPNFDVLANVIRRTAWVMGTQQKSALRPNIELLLREGVTPDRISKLIIYPPRAAIGSHRRVVQVVESLKQIGFEPASVLFIHALRVKLCISDAKWNRKVEVLKSQGWSEEDVLSAFRRDPNFLGISDEKIRRLMDFYMNTVKIDLEMIIKYPKFLSFGLTRLQRRQRVIEFLISKGLLERHSSNGWLLTESDETFLKRCIVKNLAQVPDLMEIYRGSCSSKRAEKIKI